MDSGVPQERQPVRKQRSPRIISKEQDHEHVLDFRTLNTEMPAATGASHQRGTPSGFPIASSWGGGRELPAMPGGLRSTWRPVAGDRRDPPASHGCERCLAVGVFHAAGSGIYGGGAGDAYGMRSAAPRQDSAQACGEERQLVAVFIARIGACAV